MTKHISVDIESWGVAPGDDIRSIGACVFDPDRNDFVRNEHGITETFYVACDNPRVEIMDRHSGAPDCFYDYHPADGTCRKYPLTRDPRTVQWWDDQDVEAQAAFTNPVDLKDALFRFGDWLHTVLGRNISYPDGSMLPLQDDVRIWCHGANFDPGMLEAAFRTCGLPIPWHYRAPRDTRTIFDVAGIDDHTAWLEERPGPLGIPHHALDDAICQARGICDARAIINGWRDKALNR